MPLTRLCHSVNISNTMSLTCHVNFTCWYGFSFSNVLGSDLGNLVQRVTDFSTLKSVTLNLPQQPGRLKVVVCKISFFGASSIPMKSSHITLCIQSPDLNLRIAKYSPWMSTVSTALDSGLNELPKNISTIIISTIPFLISLSHSVARLILK